jgi:hypothetical protein
VRDSTQGVLGEVRRLTIRVYRTAGRTELAMVSVSEGWCRRGVMCCRYDESTGGRTPQSKYQDISGADAFHGL